MSASEPAGRRVAETAAWNDSDDPDWFDDLDPFAAASPADEAIVPAGRAVGGESSAHGNGPDPRPAPPTGRRMAGAAMLGFGSIFNNVRAEDHWSDTVKITLVADAATPVKSGLQLDDSAVGPRLVVGDPVHRGWRWGARRRRVRRR